MPLKLRTGFAEELKLHLFKLPCSEREVTGSYLVSEALAYLCYTEGYLFVCAALHVLKVYENTLCRFGTEVYLGRGVLIYTLKRLKHHIKLAYGREIRLSALGAGYAVLLYVAFELFVLPAVGVNALYPVFLHIVLYELICTKTRLARFAVHERIVEA